MMSRVTVIQHLMHFDGGRNPGLFHDRFDSIPDPDRSIADERDAFCLPRTKAMQMHGDQFGHRIGTAQRIAIYAAAGMPTDRSCVELFRFVEGVRVTCGINEFHAAADARLYQVSGGLSRGIDRRPTAAS